MYVRFLLGHHRMTADHKSRHLKFMILVLFCTWEDARICGH